MRYILKPTKQRLNKKHIIGFDIETYANNKKFLFASTFDGRKHTLFYTRDELIEYFKQQQCHNSYVAATNLGFDFFGTFYKHPELKEFDLLFRGSHLITAKSWVKNGVFTKRNKKASKPVTFIDTMNYAMLSVDDLGKILGIPKLKSTVTDCIGKKPQTQDQWDRMIEYNKRDSEISQKAIVFLFDAFHQLGATPKMTIASTSMSLFKNKYLNDNYYLHYDNVLLDQFKGYYGGNTHAYARGKIQDYNYYDFNSLYPYCMLNELPDPNTLHTNKKNTINYIEAYPGMSHVSVSCPDMKYPFLSYRYDTKLIAPTGTFTGWYTHEELRYAMKLGYTITKVHTCYYYTDVCYPLKEYVTDLYKNRQRYQRDNNPMQLVVKILMNGLYGKFGQKFIGRDNFIPFNHTVEELDEFDFFERVGDFLRIKQNVRPSSFCIPIWASYITSYARKHLHEYMLKCDPVYVDTDSLITKRTFIETDKLGGLKREMKITNGILVKPKMYCVTDGRKSYVKIKGLGRRLSRKEFTAFMTNPSHTYLKFTKFKEAIRRGLTPNELIEITKTYDLEDTKRDWEGAFNTNELQWSTPLELQNGEVKQKGINIPRNVPLVYETY